MRDIQVRFVGFLILVAVGLLVSLGLGCVGTRWRGMVKNQASFDHQCPEENIIILRNSGDAMARTVDVNVCGTARRYRDVGGQVYLWQDITEE